ncbi:MAG TPA: hypothetical protein VMW31_03435 [Devosiaceae bacterium]|nr:hypothetical protein [Devosiaceae bacterium]
MVLLRSAFWLGVGYFVVQSGQVDARRSAEELSAGALALGQRFVVEQIAASECDAIECTAILAAMLTSKSSTEPQSSGLQQDLILNLVAPAPPPRPEWAG